MFYGKFIFSQSGMPNFLGGGGEGGGMDPPASAPLVVPF
jgi:hypothetical protein